MASSSVQRWFSQNVWTPDEKLAKKDDDLKLPHHTGNNWQAARTPRRRRALIRYATYALAVLCLVLLCRRIAYSPEEDIVRPYSQYRNHDSPTKGVPTQLTAPKATPKPPIVDPKSADDSIQELPEDRSTDDARHYRGTINFKTLAASLRHLSSARFDPGVSHVVFAASNLQSAATVLPMACQRAASQKDRIFFVLFGDSDIKLDSLLKVNGIDTSCKIFGIGKQRTRRTTQSL